MQIVIADIEKKSPFKSLGAFAAFYTTFFQITNRKKTAFDINPTAY